MKKFLSSDASDEVIKYWRDKGYEIVFTFSPEAGEEVVVRPDMSKNCTCTILDPDLEGSW